MSQVGRSLDIESTAPFSGRRKRIVPRAALVSGFLALLVLMAILAFDAIRSLRDLEASNFQVRQDYLTRERTLRKIRVSIYESGTLLREYTLSDSSPKTRESYLEQLHDMRDHSNAAMASCLRQAPPNLQLPVQKLASELEGYWRAIDHILGEGVHKNNQVLLHREALAQRASVLALTTEVSSVNELELKVAEMEISSVFARSRSRLQNFSSLAIGIGLVLAAVSVLYVSRLEDRAEEKYMESLRCQRELKALSKRLVDAQEDERRAISRELHDQIAQTLTALLMDVQDLIDSPEGRGSSRSPLQKIRLLAEDCVSKVRNMTLLLRPSMLDDLGLVAALEWQGREVSKRSGLVVEIRDRNFVDDLPDEHKTCIYRVVQEALNNCTTHSKASHVCVSLAEDTERCVLSINDDGVGFDPHRNRGIGLLGMHERVARLGGTFAIDSASGAGTRIQVELPLHRTTETAGRWT
jgi:signal transduction histidine kinase